MYGQAAIGAKIIARETVKAVRKDVMFSNVKAATSPVNASSSKTEKGKKRMRQVGNVEVPQSAFLLQYFDWINSFLLYLLGSVS
ncbi:MAG: hypothetical protein R2759_03545 [Bacteroidales bacterium]